MVVEAGGLKMTPTDEKYQKIREEIANKVVESYRPLLSEGIERIIQSGKEQIYSGKKTEAVICQLEYLSIYLSRLTSDNPILAVTEGLLKVNVQEVELREMIARKRKQFKRGERSYRELEKKYGIPAKTLCRAESPEEFLTFAKTLQVVEVYFKDNLIEYNRAIELIDSLKTMYPERIGKRYTQRQLEEIMAKS
jgi:hypothetical protein